MKRVALRWHAQTFANSRRLRGLFWGSLDFSELTFDYEEAIQRQDTGGRSDDDAGARVHLTDLVHALRKWAPSSAPGNHPTG
jgi:hypothetical protein